MVRVCWACLLVFALALGSCIRLPEDKPEKDRGAKVEVKLPPRPNLTATPTAEKFGDGAYTVEGFIKQARTLVGSEVTLRGFVQSVESCKEGEKICGTVPHLVIVDNLTKFRHRVLVVSDLPEDVLEGYPVKSSQTLKGKVALWSPDGRLINLDGILVVPEKPKEPDADETQDKS